MNPIPRHRALVPHSPYVSAVAQATAEVDARSRTRAPVGEYAYARAFLRHLCGCKTVRACHLRRVVPLFVPSRRSSPPVTAYLAALDVLIASRGEVCPLPLPSDTGSLLFPAVVHRAAERREAQLMMKVQKREAQGERSRQQNRRRYQNLLAQAQIDLAFHTPSTVGRWYSHWQHRVLDVNDLLDCVLAWLRRTPTGRSVDVSELDGLPLWRVMLEIRYAAGAATHAQRWADRLALPDQLTVKI